MPLREVCRGPDLNRTCGLLCSLSTGVLFHNLKQFPSSSTGGLEQEYFTFGFAVPADIRGLFRASSSWVALLVANTACSLEDARLGTFGLVVTMFCVSVLNDGFGESTCIERTPLPHNCSMRPMSFGAEGSHSLNG